MTEEFDDGRRREGIDDIPCYGYPTHQEFRYPPAYQGGDISYDKRSRYGSFQVNMEHSTQADDHDDLDGNKDEVIAGRQLRHDKGGRGAGDGGCVYDPSASFSLEV